jgi:AMMECR1 domain-containing protein
MLGPAQPVPPGTQSQQLWRLCPGQDGVILSCQHQGRLYRSTFLPQVWDTLPDVRVFMAQLKRKAGLPADFWSDQMQLQTYRVHKFREATHDRSVQSPAKLG